MGKVKKKIIEVAKDFGEWKVPTSWSEVTLKQYQEIERYYADKETEFDVREVLHIFCNRSIDEVNELPIEFTEVILQQLSFLSSEKLDYGEPKNYIEIDGERYTIHFENQLRTGEYVAADAIIKQDRHNYAAILAVLARKEGETYDSKFENEVVEERVKMFEELPITKLTPLLAFFLNLSALYVPITPLFSKTEEAVNLIAKSGETLVRNGEWLGLSILWRTRKLRKLLKSIKSI